MNEAAAVYLCHPLITVQHIYVQHCNLPALTHNLRQAGKTRARASGCQNASPCNPGSTRQRCLTAQWPACCYLATVIVGLGSPFLAKARPNAANARFHPPPHLAPRSVLGVGLEKFGLGDGQAKYVIQRNTQCHFCRGCFCCSIGTT